MCPQLRSQPFNCPQRHFLYFYFSNGASLSNFSFPNEQHCDSFDKRVWSSRRGAWRNVSDLEPSEALFYRVQIIPTGSLSRKNSQTLLFGCYIHIFGHHILRKNVNARARENVLPTTEKARDRWATMSTSESDTLRYSILLLFLMTQLQVQSPMCPLNPSY